MVNENTFLIPIIRTDLIRRCLETLYRYTPNNFYVFVIDQSKKGIEKDIISKYIHLYLKSHRNLGFAKAFNTGLKLCETKYFSTVNDDVEFISPLWWEGILKTFSKVDKATPQRPCAMVNPSSIKLPDWSVGKPKGEDHYILPYKENYTEEDWNFLISQDHYVNQYLTIKPGTVIDGVTMYCSIFRKRYLDEIGCLDERYYPGGAEDYDWACRSNMKGYRSVGTTLSWVFHHWSKSFQSILEEEECRSLIDDKLRFGNHNDIWGENFDLWGMKCPQCQKSMRVIKGTDYAICPQKHQRYKMPQIGKIPL